MNYRQGWTALALLAALTLGAAQPAAADEREGDRRGPGMMDRYGPGHDRDDTRGPSWRHGPRDCPGPGGRSGYGPGMMGHGYMEGGGPGMMGPGGMGMGGERLLEQLDLDNAQREQAQKILDGLRRKNWDTMGKLLDERARMRDLLRAEPRDPGAIGKQSMKMAELRRQMLEAKIEAHNRIEALLTPAQREQLRQRHQRGWMHDD